MLAIEKLTIDLAGRRLVGPVDLSVGPGQFVAITGPSGCGKSTLLTWVLGALDPAFSASGQLVLNGTRRDEWPVRMRRIGILFQDDLLYPHWSVGQNIAYGLPPRYRSRQERRARIEEALAVAGLAGSFDRDPATLSGGQRARVALMRAIVNEPEALLLDEPFSKLDRPLRREIAAFVRAEIARHGIPTLLVSHDEADLEGASDIICLKGEEDA